MEEFVVYILYSESADRLYIGFSNNSLERFYWHNGKSSKGFTLAHRPWKMVHVEFFETKASAMTREKMLKGGKGREWIRKKVLFSMRHLGFISA